MIGSWHAIDAAERMTLHIKRHHLFGPQVQLFLKEIIFLGFNRLARVERVPILGL